MHNNLWSQLLKCQHLLLFSAFNHHILNLFDCSSGTLKGQSTPKAKLHIFPLIHPTQLCLFWRYLLSVFSPKYNGTWWHRGAQTAKIIHVKNSTAMSLSRHHCPTTQNSPPGLVEEPFSFYQAIIAQKEASTCSWRRGSCMGCKH